MRNLILAAALALATPVLASDGMASDVNMDTVLGTTLQEVTATLAGMGYEVRKSEMEDGKLEVYFVNMEKKTMGEAYVDLATGKITKLEIE